MPDPKLVPEVRRRINHTPTDKVVIPAYGFQKDQEIPHMSSKHNPPFTLSPTYGIPVYFV